MIGSVEREMVSAAEAMPADKFDFKPSETMGEFKGVRTFAEQLRHVATTNFMLAASLNGEKAPYTQQDEDRGPANIKTREQTLQFLKDSFAALHKAMKTVTDENLNGVLNPGPFGGPAPRLYGASVGVWHSFDHYGQIALYLRMNGIVPPASRQQ
jgi:hypothetical protein